jgi:LacI family transcriptional regulator, galactose operon repressor
MSRSALICAFWRKTLLTRAEALQLQGFMTKHPTQADVARLAGVSRATVSYVVNGLAEAEIPITDETRQRVLKAVQQLGYHPDARAQSLRSGITNTIGLLIPDMQNPHYWEIANGVEQQLQTENFDLLLATTSLDPEREIHFVDALSRRRIDGLILLLTYPDRVKDRIETLANSRMPLVLVGSRLSDTDPNLAVAIDCAEPNYYDGALQTMRHMIGLGHRRIGFVYGVADPQLGTDRLNAYQDALASAGLEFDQNLIEPCGTTLEAGYEATLRLLERSPRPTAILVINDLLAIGALRAASVRAIRVPDDLSIASFDDIEMAAYASPPLTTMRVNAEEIGRTAARLLMMRLQNPSLTAQHARIPSRLVVRGSTGRVPSK